MHAVGKINFCVVQVTGEDEDYPASELNVHGPAVKGWQTPRFCHYPQEVVFQLEARCRISKIQILSHQYLIATKIELYLGDVPKGSASAARNIKWQRLGEFTLSDNSVTDYRARELKSVLTDAIGSFLRMVLHQNYINRLNLCNQVGLIGLNVIGSKSSKDDFSDLDLRSWRKQKPSVFDDIAFEMYLDKEVRLLIRKLEDKKIEAIHKENFEVATKIKDCMVQLQLVGEKLGKLEIEKHVAVDAENYDKARSKKEKMDRLRVKSYKSLNVVELLGIQKEFSPKLESPITEHSKPRRLSTPPPKKAPPLVSLPVKSPTPPVFRKSTQDAKTSYQNYDEMIIPTLRNKKTTTAPPSLAPVPIPPPTSRQNIKRSSTTNQITSVQTSTPTKALPLPSKETLSTSGRKKMTLPNIPSIPELSKQVYGLPLIEKLLAKSFAQRELGLRGVLQFLKQYKEKQAKHDPSQVLKATEPIMQRLLHDKVHSVFAMATEIVDHMFSKFLLVNRVTREELVESAHLAIEWALLRVGDSNPRIKQTAITCLIITSSNRIIQDTNLIPMILLRPFDAHVNANECEGRCVLVEKLLHRFHVRSTPWLSTSSIMTFALRALEHNASPVREAAERVILTLYIQVGDAILPLIPEHGGRPPYVHLLKELERLDDQGKSKSRLSTAGPSSKAESFNYEADELDNFCIFCKTRSSQIISEGLDAHFWRDCPMLNRCQNCQMIVEISFLTEHLLGECDYRDRLRQCPRCMEAILATHLNNHYASRQCIPAKPEYIANRCPLCHEDIPAWDDGWRQHIMEKPGCPANPRNHHLRKSSFGARNYQTGQPTTTRFPSRRTALKP